MFEVAPPGGPAAAWPGTGRVPDFGQVPQSHPVCDSVPVLVGDGHAPGRPRIAGRGQVADQVRVTRTLIGCAQGQVGRVIHPFRPGRNRTGVLIPPGVLGNRSWRHVPRSVLINDLWAIHLSGPDENRPLLDAVVMAAWRTKILRLVRSAEYPLMILWEHDNEKFDPKRADHADGATGKKAGEAQFPDPFAHRAYIRSLQPQRSMVTDAHDHESSAGGHCGSCA